MNYRENESGRLVPAIGSVGSIADAESRFPGLIAEYESIGYSHDLAVLKVIKYVQLMEKDK